MSMHKINLCDYLKCIEQEVSNEHHKLPSNDHQWYLI